MLRLRTSYVTLLVVLSTWIATDRCLHAATPSEARLKLQTGNYAEAIAMAEEAIEAGTWSERWPRILMEAQLATGEYEAAVKTFGEAMRRYSSSLQLRMLAIEAFRHTGQMDQADAVSAQIFDLLQRSPSRYSGSENLITAGRYFANRGEDARKILELFYDRVKEREPSFVATYIATAELALSKHDYAVAADALEIAADLDPQDPHIAFLAAKAWASSDSQRAEVELRRALEINSKHVPSLLMQADHWIDREQYDLAEQVLAEIEQVNAQHPLLWAYRNVIAHLTNQPEKETEARDKALATWPTNPEVDFIIGRELSQKYRFTEGAAAQRRALEFDPNYLKARFQLAQDLLRLGQDEVGWELAKWTQESDAYNVVAYNLMNLRDILDRFTVLRDGNLLVRMESHEAEVYGPEVIELLHQAEEFLCDKYEVTPDGPIVVEIFPRQQDFAIRTFGLPGGDGFLGVCFGKVITANSPASQGPSPSNWKSVLWHEFCHVVTLSKTNNRMPRWLSEGISVYEERLRDPTWGQQMTPTFRRMILGDDLVPISKLSGAFLAPPSGMHLQLAYFESSLAVEFLIEEYGQETVNRILVDLGVGIPINETLQRYSGSLQKLDEDFLTFARSKARVFGCRFDWTEDDLPESADSSQWAEWLETHPNNYWGLSGYAAALLNEQKYEEAEAPLLKIQELFADDYVDTTATIQLATIYRTSGSRAKEKETLERLSNGTSDQLPQLLRLTEIYSDEGNWIQVLLASQKATAINPLLSVVHENLTNACDELDRPEDAARSLEIMATMDPLDPALLHFRTARAWQARGDDSKAKRHVLMALEEAPHYRDAQALLLELNASIEKKRTNPTKNETAAPAAATGEDTTKADAESISGAESAESDASDQLSDDQTSAPDVPNASDSVQGGNYVPR